VTSLQANYKDYRIKDQSKNQLGWQGKKLIKKHRKGGIPAMLLRPCYRVTGCPVLNDQVLPRTEKKKKNKTRKPHQIKTTQDRVFLIFL